MKTSNFLTFVSAIAMAGWSVSIMGQNPVDVTKIDELFKQWDNNNTPGVAVGVVSDGELIFAKGYGMANLEQDIDMMM